MFAACPLANSGALIADIWDAKTRGKALAIFSVAPFAGPALGPVVAGFMNVAGVSWRWLFWILTIFAGICCLIIIFTMPETYQPILLVKKAQRMRMESGDSRYYAPLERRELDFAAQLESVLAKPFKILAQEPMLIACTVYMSFIYGCVYLLFVAFPIVFSEGHHFNSGVSGLMFLPLPVGGATAIILYILIFNPRYERWTEEYSPSPVPPEKRLEMACIAAPLFAGSFFWFAWTSDPSISFWAPMMAAYLMGFTTVWIFLSLVNYIIDTYLMIAASALSATIVVRSLFGAGFPLFANQMYVGLRTHWASSLVGFVALALTPIPFIFVKYGPVLREKSKNAPTRPGPPPLAIAESFEPTGPTRQKESETSAA